MKKAILVHGWDASANGGWFPWLQAQLEENGFTVVAPQLPDKGTPKIETWVPALAAVAGTPDKETYFVGHSMGCQTIARYLETLPESVQVGGVVYVSGFFKRLTNLESAEEEEIAAPWFSTPLDLEKVRAHAPKSIAIFSDDDQWVPLDNQDDFRDKLGSEIIIEHAKGHFSFTDTTELPSALAAVLKLAQ